MAVFSRRTLILLLLRKRLRLKNIKYRKRFWVRKIFQERNRKSEFHILVQEIKLFDHEYFFRCFRMNPTTYEHLLNLTAPFLVKSSLRREAISPSERLAVTLRYLVTGCSQIHIGTSFRISPTSMGRIIAETCRVIWNVLSSQKCIDPPRSEKEWRNIAKSYELQWNFPHCIGALDGKHVMMQAPARSGSYFFNYKKTHSIVLLAVCNTDYEFTLVDVGNTGRVSDGGVYSTSLFGQALDKNALNVPEPDKLPGTDIILPYVLVADDAFQLKKHIMKPFPVETLGPKERIFNYRLCRARRIIENTFGITTARFRIFQRPIIAKVETVIHITKAVVALHNFLMRRKYTRSSYCPHDFVDHEIRHNFINGHWRGEISSNNGLIPIKRIGSNNYSKDAKETRQGFRDYFCSRTGEVPWQWDVLQNFNNRFDGN